MTTINYNNIWINLLWVITLITIKIKVIGFKNSNTNLLAWWLPKYKKKVNDKHNLANKFMSTKIKGTIVIVRTTTLKWLILRINIRVE